MPRAVPGEQESLGAGIELSLAVSAEVKFDRLVSGIRDRVEGSWGLFGQRHGVQFGRTGQLVATSLSFFWRLVSSLLK